MHTPRWTFSARWRSNETHQLLRRPGILPFLTSAEFATQPSMPEGCYAAVRSACARLEGRAHPVS